MGCFIMIILAFIVGILIGIALEFNVQEDKKEK